MLISNEKTQSCLRDAVMTLAVARAHLPIMRDLSVIRRDTVPSTYTGSRRATINLLRIQNVIVRNHISVAIVSNHHAQLSKHVIGVPTAPSLGALFWDCNAKCVSVCPPLTLRNDHHLLNSIRAPWLQQCAGGKRAKAKAKRRRGVSSSSDTELLHKDNAHAAKEDVPASAVNSGPTSEVIYARRTAIPIYPHRCKARTYELWQCSKPPQELSDVCAQHNKTVALKHGRIENPFPEWLREYFLRTAHTRVKRGHRWQWYSRNNMFQFAKRLGKDSVEDLTDAGCVDGLHAVHVTSNVAPLCVQRGTSSRKNDHSS